MEEEKKMYEIGFVADQENTKAEVVKIIKDLEGEVFKEGEISKIKLAYPIKKQTNGFFSYIQFFLKPENLNNLKESLKFSPSILRFLVIKLTKSEKENALKKKTVFVKTAPKKMPEALSNEELEKKLEEVKGLVQKLEP